MAIHEAMLEQSRIWYSVFGGSFKKKKEGGVEFQSVHPLIVLFLSWADK